MQKIVFVATVYPDGDTSLSKNEIALTRFALARELYRLSKDEGLPIGHFEIEAEEAIRA